MEGRAARAARWLGDIALAVFLTAVALALRRLLDPLLGGSLPLVTLYGAVAFAVWQRGTLPAILTTALGYAAAYMLYLRPSSSGGTSLAAEMAGLAAYLLSCGITVVLGTTMRRAERRALTGEALAREREPELRQQIELRALAEGEAVERREWFETTLASIGDAVIATDIEGRVTFLNTVAASLTGWSLAEALGQPLETIFRIENEKTRRPVDNPVRRVLAEGHIIGLANHTVLIAKDGTERAIDDSAAPIRNPSGAILGVVLVFRDVTGQRALELDRQRLAAIVESSHDAIYGKSLDGRITSWNRAAETLYGYSSDEVRGRPLEVIVPPEKREELGMLMDRVRRNEPTDHLATLRLRKDGSIVPISLRVSPIRDSEGEVVGAASIARDITREHEAARRERFISEASRALATLDDAESTLQKLVRFAVPAVFDAAFVDVAGPDGLLRRVAVAHRDIAVEPRLRAAPDLCSGDSHDAGGSARVMRTGRRELILDPAAGPSREAGGDEVTADRLAALRGLGFTSFLCVPLRTRHAMLGALSVAMTGAGRAIGPDDVAMVQDLADRAAASMETAQLYVEAQESSRRKDEFLALLAHELRNPLAPIRNAVEILRRPDGPAPAGRAGVPGGDHDEWARAVIERQTRQLARLVDDLLDVSRISRGRLELRKEPVDLATLVGRAVESTSTLLEARRHALAVSLPEEAVPLFVDPARIEQVIINLLNNAARYTDPGGRIELRATRLGDEAEIRVSDNGSGIDPAFIEHVFDLFVQGDGTGGTGQGGLGIGLSLVRTLVEMHGGTVMARSEGRGRGSEFLVRLPVARGAPRAEPGGEAPGAAGSNGPDTPRDVLVVDDNADAAETISRLLADRGHRVRTAYDGESALAFARESPPEVVLLDLGLPGIDGHTVAREIRTLPGGRDAFLIAVTGWGQEKTRRRSFESGFDLHLTKPVEPDELLRAMARRGYGIPGR